MCFVLYSSFDSIDFGDIKNNPNAPAEPVAYQLLSQNQKTVGASVATCMKGIFL
tara:strand:- start:438 stop:599 length:162 start_codon:yes stop_codon:yes gene_type:complete